VTTASVPGTIEKAAGCFILVSAQLGGMEKGAPGAAAEKGQRTKIRRNGERGG